MQLVEDLEQDWIIQGHRIMIKGKESIYPGLLTKFIKSLEITKDISYDFVVRSNISTVIDYNQFIPLLDEYYNKGFQYGAFNVCDFIISNFGNYFDQYNVNKKYTGIKFLSGTCMFFSKEIVKKLLVCNNLRYDIHDDVALSLFANDLNQLDKIINLHHLYISNQYDPNKLCFRVHSYNRKHDVQVMKQIINEILDQNPIDIIFSITCHEAPDCVIDMVQNIKYFCKKINFKIILHCNPPLHTILQQHFKDDSQVILHPNPFWMNQSVHLTQKHLQNFQHVQHLNFKYFCLLASNCLMIKELTREDLDNQNVEKIMLKGGHIPYDTWHFPTFFKNQYIVEQLKDIELIGCLHEGSLYTKEQFGKINDFIFGKQLFENMTCDSYYEEILLPSLAKHFSKDGYLKSICKTFSEIPGSWRPLPINIEECRRTTKYYCVKRVFRTYNDDVRKWLRESNHFYN
jgi:hypothetical protein